MEYQLYKFSKMGKILSFNILVIGPSIVTTKGFMDGAKQVDKKVFEEGKNLGRANETTPKEQAKAEATSQYKKLLDKGYKLSPASFMPEEWPTQGDIRAWLIEQGVGTDASGKLKPMLAHKNISPITFPCYGNYKYDGVRCFSFITWDSDDDVHIQKVSRNGKRFTHLDHLDANLSEFFDFDCIVDGELYSHELTFQKNISSIKRKQKSNTMIGLRIYDVIPMNNQMLDQKGRWEILKRLKKMAKTYPGELDIEFAPYFKIEDMDDVKELHLQAVSLGFEGTIFRNPKGHYHFGQRSRFLMKHKDHDEEEFEIIGAEEATGRDVGTAVMVLKTKEGVRFTARPMGDRRKRADYLINIHKYIGKMGTVRFNGYTDDGSIRFPRFKCVRDYE